ncbi:hypothetical protein XELAEV_18026843mg [Xenopus laevis]|uniref:Uncharacterized protein n=1 Tax=Xenopus laevis TaxID=8355 RepID=A0A974HJQ6_XENLA|nr:hypothetical protein XELAEV_18026843mg [Xenopus laevis]
MECKNTRNICSLPSIRGTGLRIEQIINPNYRYQLHQAKKLNRERTTTTYVQLANCKHRPLSDLRATLLE